jgi:hypothetical protein
VQSEVQKLLLANLRGERPYLVKIVDHREPDNAQTLSPPAPPKALAAAPEDGKG